MLCIDPYYTALPGSPVSYAYYGRHPVLRIPIILVYYGLTALVPVLYDPIVLLIRL